MRNTFATFAVLAVVVSGSSCTANNLCARYAECQEELNDRKLADDSVAVCIAEYNGSIDVLRANEEPACQRLADAQIALDNCRAGLSCDDFAEDDLGRECDDEREALDDANDDVDFLDGECEPREN